MNQEFFEGLELIKQIEYLLRRGKHKATRQGADGKIWLVRLPRFYVEVFYNKEMIDKIIPLATEENLFKTYPQLLDEVRRKTAESPISKRV